MTGGNVPIRGESRRLTKATTFKTRAENRRQQFSDDSVAQIIVIQMLGASRRQKSKIDWEFVTAAREAGCRLRLDQDGTQREVERATRSRLEVTAQKRVTAAMRSWRVMA
jgi:hypothetical protein